jgi:hypothetical protein
MKLDLKLTVLTGAFGVSLGWTSKRGKQFVSGLILLWALFMGRLEVGIS